MTRDPFDAIVRWYVPRRTPHGARLVQRRSHGRWLAAFALAGLLALVLLWPSCARAGEFGGCFAGGALCAGPSATLTVGEFNLATQSFSGGVSPGIGYGLTLNPSQWYATGLAAYLDFSVGGGKPNRARPALMLSFADYVRLGAALTVTERDEAPTLFQWSLLFGVGRDL